MLSNYKINSGYSGYILNKPFKAWVMLDIPYSIMERMKFNV
ncbi:hypothetical protein HBHAL_2931 [Halobacillus halophilus DSM 2266]|uniref:Uncharacterized protein n=1 Tax=Halobacillus halophilus (strain ATCC 35676 / DSM 2266 / JCM 20832 / KCTC 3685 / LMG 17431 / NBRC 102448 / NCIMB 2269) TaxID=866895 RepID=I0JMA9_HALH3|nr:hypothetical protein HBHAL_2931 [Halobacillus halophilus DSM 2266]